MSFISYNPAVCHGGERLLGLAWTYLLADLLLNIHIWLSSCLLPNGFCQQNLTSLSFANLADVGQLLGVRRWGKNWCDKTTTFR